jgi:hypothetical protein
VDPPLKCRSLCGQWGNTQVRMLSHTTGTTRAPKVVLTHGNIFRSDDATIALAPFYRNWWHRHRPAAAPGRTVIPDATEPDESSG